jgi:hypothetical protein
MNGNIKWRKIIPTSESIGTGDGISPLQIMADGSIVLAAERNTIGTEIIHLSANGDIIARKTFNSSFLLAQPTHPESDLQLISQDTAQITRITLNMDLQEVQRVTEAHEPGVTYMANRLPDQSLILFGSRFRRNVYSARIMTLSPTLRHEQTLNLGSQGESYWIKTGIATGNKGGFVCARSARLPPKPGEIVFHRDPQGHVIFDEKKIADARKRTSLGVALDFVKLN